MPGNTVEQKPKRKAPPSAWKPGQSGNPAGRPRVVAEIRDLARSHGPEALETLARIMRDKAARPDARARAAEALLDRGYGRSPTTLAGEGGEGALEVVIRNLRHAPGTRDTDQEG